MNGIGRRVSLTFLGVFLGAALALSMAEEAAGQGRTSISGRVLDRETEEPVSDAVVTLVGTGLEAVTNPRGFFQFPEVAPGEYRMAIRHLAYGVHVEPLVVEEGEALSLQVGISQTAIVLEPLTVEVYSARDLRARASGVRLSEVTRPQLELAARTGMHLGNVLEVFVPGIRMQQHPYLVGLPICVEFRGARYGSFDGTCRSPAVYLDGIPVSNPTFLYGSLSMEEIERLEVVPPAEAGVRYGTGALYGALVVETRRGGRDREGEAFRLTPPGIRAFDWSQEGSSHDWKKTYLYSLAGNALGLAVGVALADQCIEVVAPAYDRVGTQCGPWPTMGSALAGLGFPAMGGSLGARLGGRTERSQGDLVASVVAGVMVLVPGYAMVISSRRSEWRKTGMTGKALLVLGVPAAATFSDHLFRVLRRGAGP